MAEISSSLEDYIEAVYSIYKSENKVKAIDVSRRLNVSRASTTEALQKLDEELWDTFVVDFYNEGCSESEFVKKVNNYPDSILVALNLAPFTLPEERNRYKIEPLRKLFEIEKPKAEDEEASSEDEDSFNEDNFRD